MTKEIRIHLEKGDDKVKITGNVKSSPMVRVVGGDGKDEFVDESKVDGYFLSFTPFPKAERKSVFYDSGKKSVVKKGAGTKHIKTKVPKPKPKNDEEKYENLQKNRGHEWYGAPMISSNPDDGFVVGAMALHFKYGFRMKPFKYSLSLNASYATKTSSSHIALKGIFNSLIRGASVHLSLLKTQLEFKDYFGYGNESVFDSKLHKEDYYETEEEFTVIRPSIHFNLFKHASVGIGIGYTATDIELENVLLLRDTPHYRYGLGKHAAFDISGSLLIDSRDKPANAHKGFYLRLDGSFTPEMLDSRYSYVKAGFDVRTYLTAKTISETTLALRVAGEKILGRFPLLRCSFPWWHQQFARFQQETFFR